ncbi:hypothetical protein [Halobacteriovorax sp. HLS]|uniref:hypothetical protein n=1 Tax=Halobacteriovorax sp. HLS TaxID=2234000 RepID=UPI0013E3736A|nr:hypothetical protein [Halobacteriovorax sp. HLS]
MLNVRRTTNPIKIYFLISHASASKTRQFSGGRGATGALSMVSLEDFAQLDLSSKSGRILLLGDRFL